MNDSKHKLLLTSIMLILLGTLSSVTLAQSRHHISGKIYFEEDSLAVPRAHVYFKGTGVGTTTNEEGRFQLNLAEKHYSDTLAISYMGYIPYEIPLSGTIDQELQVYLKRSAMFLQEVAIAPVDARRVVKTAVARMDEHYSKKKNKYTVHFKETRWVDSVCTAYLEVAADLISKGYDSHSVGRQDYQAYIKGKRTSYSFDTAFNAGNGLFVAFWMNWTRRFLTKKALKNYTFEYEGLTSYMDEEVYKIRVTTKKQQETTYLYITKADYAIAAIDCLFDNSRQRKPKEGRDWWFLECRQRIDFRKKEEKWFAHTITDYRKAMHKTGRIVECNRNINVLNVEAGHKKLDEKHRIKPETDLFHYPIAYEPDFWESYNAPLDTEQEKRIKTELERNGVELQKQFTKDQK